MRDFEIVGFDFEVFKQDWFVTFKNLKTKDTKTFRNDPNGLISYIEQNKASVCFVGFNSKNFDIPCLKCVYYGINPYRVVHWVIREGQKWWTMPELKYKKNIEGLIHYDVRRYDNDPSLKEGEANLGMSIEEMNFDLEYGGKIKDEDYERLLKYNIHDVDATLEIFQKDIDKYNAVKTLIEHYNLPWTSMSKTFAQLTAEILKAKKIAQQEFFKYQLPKCLEGIKDKHVVEQYTNHCFLKDESDDGVSFTRKIQKVECGFGIGGIHGAIKTYTMKPDSDYVIVCADVTSLYPNLMTNKTNPEFQFLSRAVPSRQTFRSIVDERIMHKKNKNLALSNPLKEPINAAYGVTLNKTSPMYDWVQGRNICITGQLAAWLLAEKINFSLPTCEIIQINTDGIYIKIHKNDVDKLKEIFKEWEQALGTELEVEIITNGGIWQKDVNNYVLYNADTKKMKTCGGFVSYWDGGDWKKNSATIVDEAVVKYLVFNKPINETLMEAYDKNEVLKFQIVLARKKSTYTATMLGDKIVQKVNRVFPVINMKYNNGVDEATLPQVKRSDIFYEDTLAKCKGTHKEHFPDAPYHCTVQNGDIKDINLKELNLNLNYYIAMIQKRLQRFKKG